MNLLRFTFMPKTAFATPIKGDTLFGQCCWAIRHGFGESRLTDLLDGYTQGKPFLVLSDALPQGFLRRPTLPLEMLGFDLDSPEQRKKIKAKRWLPESVLAKPLPQWSECALSESELVESLGLQGSLSLTAHQMHNSLNRLTGTTGKGEGFAPFDLETFWFHPEVPLAVYAVLDETRLSRDELKQAMAAVGQQGYGKEASAGLGKFEITAFESWQPAAPSKPGAWLTLAPCAPQGLPWDAEHCYYEPFTRFGRHGDAAVHTGKPFKNPVLLADSFAVLTLAEFDLDAHFTGQGIGGISRAIEQTVQQGYAPVVAVHTQA